MAAEKKIKRVDKFAEDSDDWEDEESDVSLSNLDLGFGMQHCPNNTCTCLDTVEQPHKVDCMLSVPLWLPITKHTGLHGEAYGNTCLGLNPALTMGTHPSGLNTLRLLFACTHKRVLLLRGCMLACVS